MAIALNLIDNNIISIQNQLIYLKILSSGVITGNEPSTMICKISGNTKRDIPFIWRLMGFMRDGIHMDEALSKTEYLFYHDILPLMDGTGYLTPKIYFIGNLYL